MIKSKHSTNRSRAIDVSSQLVPWALHHMRTLCGGVGYENLCLSERKVVVVGSSMSTIDLSLSACHSSAASCSLSHTSLTCTRCSASRSAPSGSTRSEARRITSGLVVGWAI